jgi:FkbM family methyltransferase
MKLLPPLEVLMKHERDLCEQIAEQQAKVVPVSESLLCRVLGKYLLYVDPKDISMTPHLAMLGHWEMWVTMAIARYVPRGGIHIDVGAAYGYYTVLLADLAGKHGKVYAFEPNVLQHQRLRNTIAVNGFGGRVELRPQVVADKSGELSEFTRSLTMVGASALSSYYDANDSPLKMSGLISDSVPSVKLDDVTEKVDFVKIDVEGAEDKVWDGMRLLRGRNRNIQILMELTPLKQKDLGRRILEEAIAEGFRLLEVDIDGSLKPQTVDELIRTDGIDLRMIWMSR